AEPFNPTCFESAGNPITDKVLDVPSPAVARHAAPIRSRETQPCGGDDLQHATKSLNDQVAPLMSVEPPNKEYLIRITFFQPPSLGYRHRPCGVGNYLSLWQCETVEVTHARQDIARRSGHGVRNTDCLSLLSYPVSKSFVVGYPSRRAVEKPWAVETDTDWDRGCRA